MIVDPVTLALAKSWADGEFGDLRPLVSHVPEVLGSRIVDHNLDVEDPPNGWYVRWANGLQRFFIKKTVSISTAEGSGEELYYWRPGESYNWPASVERILATSPPAMFAGEVVGVTFRVLSRGGWEPIVRTAKPYTRSDVVLYLAMASTWKDVSA